MARTRKRVLRTRRLKRKMIQVTGAHGHPLGVYPPWVVTALMQTGKLGRWANELRQYETMYCPRHNLQGKWPYQSGPEHVVCHFNPEDPRPELMKTDAVFVRCPYHLTAREIALALAQRKQ